MIKIWSTIVIFVKHWKKNNLNSALQIRSKLIKFHFQVNASWCLWLVEVCWNLVPVCTRRLFCGCLIFDAIEKRLKKLVLKYFFPGSYQELLKCNEEFAEKIAFEQGKVQQVFVYFAS